MTYSSTRITNQNEFRCMVHLGRRNWNYQTCVNSRRSLPSAGGVELREQSLQVAQSFGPPGVTQGLVLGQYVDEALTDLVTVLSQQLPPGLTERRDHITNLAVRTEARVRHAAEQQAERVAARRPWPPRGGRANVPERRPARRPGRSARGTSRRPPAPERLSACPCSLAPVRTGAAPPHR